MAFAAIGAFASRVGGSMGFGAQTTKTTSWGSSRAQTGAGITSNQQFFNETSSVTNDRSGRKALSLFAGYEGYNALKSSYSEGKRRRDRRF